MNLLSRLGTLACLFAALLVRAEDLDWRVHLVQEVEVDGVIVESIDEMQYTGAGFTTSNATARAGYLFCGWKTNTKQDSESGFVARDYWGRAYEQVSFGLYEPMTNTAVYISADIDSDDDGMPDGTELYWYGDLDESPDTDTDGDGITFARELDLGLNPHFADEWRAGLAIASRMPDFFKLIMRSDPEGALFATVTNNTAPGFPVSTSRYDPRTSLFACWTQDGAEQRDDFGRALDQLAFEMPTHDVELVAVCREDENARAALYWYGDEFVAPTSDTDGDGITLAEEFTTGTNPLFADEYRRGIMCASRKPQFFKLILRSDPENALFPTTTNNVAQGIVKTTSAYSPTSSQFAYWTVDGARQCDEFGRALDAVSVEMPPHDVEVVAVCREDVEQREALYWYGDDTVDYTSDRDGDGLSFGEEVACGTNPLFADEWRGGVRCASRKPRFFKYTLRSEPEGQLFPTVVESVCPGVIKTTDAYSPDTSLFAYWSVAGTSSRDEFGRALDFVSLEMPTNDIEVVAHCVEAPDVRESVYWYGNETTEMTSDTDGDGMTFGEEITCGTNPLFADEWHRSVDHALAAFELFTCIIRSEPEGALFETRKLNIGPGVSVNAGTCDHLATDFSFWTLNGVRQADVFGRAWDTLTFTMPSTNTEAIAVCREDEKVRDAYYWYGREMSDESDTDGDGFTFAQERFNGTNPLFADTNMFTGIRHALTELLEVDLQPFEQMRGTIVGGEYEELFTSPLAENEGASTTFGANAAPLAVDFDGDGLFDLMVASQQGLKVFHNAGSVANPDFRETPSGFGDWSNLAKLMAGMKRPVICGADGIFYVSDNGGAIYRFTLADGSLIETGLVGIPGILDGQLVALSANGQLVASGEKPVCTLDMPVIDGLSISFADIDCDGRTDFLASDADGHIWLFRNTSTANNLLYGRYSFVLQYKVWAGTCVGFAEGMTMSTVDWEDDGDTDVLIGTGEGKLMLLRDPKTGRPTNVRAYAGTDNVLLEWDPNSQPRIRGYNVYRTPLPDAEYLRIANQVPVPRYRDVPSVLCDYWYRITGLSRFYIAGNSTPTYYESMPTDAIFVQFRPSVWLNDTSSFTETNVEMIVSINNSMGILADGLAMSFGYDSNVLEPVEVRTTGLTEGVAFSEVKVKGEGEQWNWNVSASSGEIKTGAGMFLKLVFYVKPWCGVARTEVALNAATMKALDGRAINLDLPKVGAIEIAERRYEPAVMSVAVGSVATDTCEEFEVPVTITASETLTNFAAKVDYDISVLELRGVEGATLRRGTEPAPFYENNCQ